MLSFSFKNLKFRKNIRLKLSMPYKPSLSYKRGRLNKNSITDRLSLTTKNMTFSNISKTFPHLLNEETLTVETYRVIFWPQ